VIGASAIGAQRPRLWPPIWRDAGYGVNAGPRDLLTTTSITLEATSGLQREPHSAAAPLSFGLDRQQRLENDNLIALPTSMSCRIQTSRARVNKSSRCRLASGLRFIACWTSERRITRQHCPTPVRRCRSRSDSLCLFRVKSPDWRFVPRTRPCDVPIRVLDKFLVCPLRALASSPDLSENELSRDRSSRNDYRPQVPAARLSVCRHASV